MAPQLDMGNARVLFAQRGRRAAGLEPTSPEEAATAATVAAVAAARATTAAATVVHGRANETYVPRPPGGAPRLVVRQCALRPLGGERTYERDGRVIRIGSCNTTDELPPMPLPATLFAGGGCAAGGGGCGLAVQLSAARVAAARPPGAPVDGNVTVNILGGDLSSMVPLLPSPRAMRGARSPVPPAPARAVRPLTLRAVRLRSSACALPTIAPCPPSRLAPRLAHHRVTLAALLPVCACGATTVGGDHSYQALRCCRLPLPRPAATEHFGLRGLRLGGRLAGRHAAALRGWPALCRCRRALCVLYCDGASTSSLCPPTRAPALEPTLAPALESGPLPDRCCPPSRRGQSARPSSRTPRA